jgi:putative endonuclease
MTYRSNFGKLGENKACEYLVDKGFKVIERNYKENWGEIDIIAIAPDKTLVFVEVKTTMDSGPDSITPENQMTASKIKKFKRTASLYAGHNQKLVDDSRGWRLDLVALTKTGNNFVINHYENIV